jgi:hypothetical protein
MPLAGKRQDNRSARAPQPSRREERRARLRTERRRSAAPWVLLSAGVLAFFVFLIFTALRPQGGEEVAILPNSPHIPVPTPPGPYNTDPPSSGLHYEATLPRGFYDEAEAVSVGPYPEGYLVHNLEHDYTIIWYNCLLLDQAGCDNLKSQIQTFLNEMAEYKLIAFPWPSQPEPVVLTHWGRILRMEEFDAGDARHFVRSNLGRSPEPNAP